MKRIFALVLSLVMALSLCAPAWGMLPISNINMGESVEITEEDGGDVPATPTSLPKATVKDLGAKTITATTTFPNGNDPTSYALNVAFQFLPTETLKEAQASPYRYWHADYVVKTNKDVPANSIALAGYYKAFCEDFNNDNWVLLTAGEDVSANTEIRLVEYMGGGMITVNYEEICQLGNDGIGFLCGAIDREGKNTGTTLTVELRLYETEEPSTENGNSHNVETGKEAEIATINYTFGGAAQIGETTYYDIAEAVANADAGDTISLMADAVAISVDKAVTINTNGKAHALVQPAEGWMMTKTGDILSFAEVVAKIGDVNYASLQEAVNDAKDGDTIELLADIDEEVGVSKALIINKNGKKCDKVGVSDSGWMMTDYETRLVFEKFIALVGAEEIPYITFEEAMAAVKNGETIVVVWDGEYKATVARKITFTARGDLGVNATFDFTAGEGFAVLKDNNTYTVLPTYKVTFDANGGEGKYELTSPVVEGAFVLPENPFTAPSGKQFKGWATSADGDVITAKTYTVNAPVTFYAIWESIPVSYPPIVNVPSVDTPAETPSETPAETPSETPVQTPVETPVEIPVETPVEVIVPVGGNENTVKVEATVSGTTATIDKVDVAELETVIGSDVDTGKVVIDLSTASAAESTEGGETVETAVVDTVEIPVEVIEQIAEAVADPENNAESLEIVLGDGASIEFNAEALAEKVAQAGGDDITISIKPTAAVAENLSAALLSTVGEAVAFDITVKSGDVAISDMGGEITITAPYELAEGETAEGIVVYYVDDAGNREKCETFYDAAAGRVSWKTNHLSVYMVAYESPADDGAADDGIVDEAPVDDAQSGSLALWVVIAVVVIAAIVAVVVISKKRKN